MVLIVRHAPTDYRWRSSPWCYTPRASRASMVTFDSAAESIKCDFHRLRFGIDVEEAG